MSWISISDQYDNLVIVRAKERQQVKWRGRVCLNLTQEILGSLPGYFLADSQGNLEPADEEAYQEIKESYLPKEFKEGDNENIYVDEEQNQQLDEETILKLKRQGDKDDLVEALVKNNRNFD